MPSRKLSLDEALAIASEASGRKLWRKKILTIGYESKLGTPIVRWLIHDNTKNRLKSVVPWSSILTHSQIQLQIHALFAAHLKSLCCPEEPMPLDLRPGLSRPWPRPSPHPPIPSRKENAVIATMEKCLPQVSNRKFMEVLMVPRWVSAIFWVLSLSLSRLLIFGLAPNGESCDLTSFLSQSSPPGRFSHLWWHHLPTTKKHLPWRTCPEISHDLAKLDDMMWEMDGNGRHFII
jgi:hypothetical protein